ncbi:MAG: hypothetical protein WC880_01655 [Candidatus Paceibacterota bacterium]
MKTHTTAEREEAKKKLPQALYDFLASPSLTKIYLGIQKKHDLNLRQLLLFTDIANITLIGLEVESALETNLHQVLHELSSEGTRELVADINDRVFKEARRRIIENIPEPSVWSKREVAPSLSEEARAEEAERDAIENMADDDPKLLAAYEADKAEALKKEEENQKELAFALEQAKNDPVIIEGNDLDMEEDAEKELSTSVDGAPVSTIVEEKMGTVAPTKPEQDPIQTPTSEKQEKVIPVIPEPQKPAYKGGVDPYREPVE